MRNIVLDLNPVASRVGLRTLAMIAENEGNLSFAKNVIRQRTLRVQ